MPSPLKRFAIASALVAATFVAVALSTELRSVMHAGLIACCVVAFLPFVLIASVVGILLLAAVVLSFVGDGGDVHASDLAGFAESLQYSGRGIRAYYQFFARHRTSVWLGIPVGVLLGSLIVWLVLALTVVPRELATTETLLRCQHEIDTYYQTHAKYPTPSEGSRLSSADGLVAVDAFGRPLDYVVRAGLHAKSYRLISLGADGVPSADDLCVEGANRLQKLIEVSRAVAELGEFLVHLKTGDPLHDRLSALRTVRCESGALERAREQD